MPVGSAFLTLYTGTRPDTAILEQREEFQLNWPQICHNRNGLNAGLAASLSATLCCKAQPRVARTSGCLSSNPKMLLLGVVASVAHVSTRPLASGPETCGEGLNPRSGLGPTHPLLKDQGLGGTRPSSRHTHLRRGGHTLRKVPLPDCSGHWWLGHHAPAAWPRPCSCTPQPSHSL